MFHLHDSSVNQIQKLSFTHHLLQHCADYGIKKRIPQRNKPHHRTTGAENRSPHSRRRSSCKKKKKKASWRGWKERESCATMGFGRRKHWGWPRFGKRRGWDEEEEEKQCRSARRWVLRRGEKQQPGRPWQGARARGIAVKAAAAAGEAGARNQINGHRSPQQICGGDVLRRSTLSGCSGYPCP
ncbi:hypothetical protein ACLOJK_020818 [Asimina triloba]